MKIGQIYEKYGIPTNLQEHMLRVAAFLQILAEHWRDKNLDTNALILTGAFHDMANIIKFNFDKPLADYTGEQITQQKLVQAEVIKKYGKDIHQATLAIGREIGLTEKVLRLINKLEWEETVQYLVKPDWEAALPVYSDMRIGPMGILTLKTRIDDLHKRHPDHDYAAILQITEKLEKSLQRHLTVDVKEISDRQLNDKFKQILAIEV